MNLLLTGTCESLQKSRILKNKKGIDQMRDDLMSSRTVGCVEKIHQAIQDAEMVMQWSPRWCKQIFSSKSPLDIPDRYGILRVFLCRCLFDFYHGLMNQKSTPWSLFLFSTSTQENFSILKSLIQPERSGSRKAKWLAWSGLINLVMILGLLNQCFWALSMGLWRTAKGSVIHVSIFRGPSTKVVSVESSGMKNLNLT